MAQATPVASLEQERDVREGVRKKSHGESQSERRRESERGRENKVIKKIILACYSVVLHIRPHCAVL